MIFIENKCAGATPPAWPFCPEIGLFVTFRAVLSTFPALAPGLQFPYAVPIRNSGNKGPQEGLQTGTIKVLNYVTCKKNA